MAGEIQASADRVFRDGSATAPFQPQKSSIRSDFAATIQSEFDQLEQSFIEAIEDITDLIATGSKQVEPVAFRTTATGPIATAFAAGTVHDTVTAVVGQRFFMDGRPESGLYTVTNGAPTRTADADQGSELPGITFLVQLGAADSGKTYVCTTPGPITLGTTPLTFKQSGQAASAVIPTLAAGTPATTPDNREFLLLSGNGSTLFRYTWENLLARIREDSMPTEYTFAGSDVVGTQAKTIIFADAKQTRATVFNLSTTGTLSVATGGRNPSIRGVGVTIGPGAAVDFDRLPPGNINAIADQGSVAIEISYSNLSNVDPNALAAADLHLARYSASLTTPMRTAIKNAFVGLKGAGWLDRGRVAVYCGPNLADQLLKWGQSGSYTRISGPTGGWTGMNFDGVDDAIDLGERLTAIASATDHTVMHYTDDTIQGSAHYAGGDSAVRNGPNRTSVSSTMHSLSSAQIVTVGGLGGLQGVTRTGAGKFLAHRDKGSAHFEQDIPVTDTAPSTSNLVDGAINGTGGLSAFYTGGIKARYAGLSLTQAQRYAGAAALETFFAAAAGF
jgi:hypothetical protein